MGDISDNIQTPAKSAPTDLENFADQLN